MSFKAKEPKVFSSKQLHAMTRDELNTVAVAAGHMPADETDSQDLIAQIMVAQNVMLEKWELNQAAKQAARPVEKAANPVPPVIKKDAASKPDPDPEPRVWFKVSPGEGKMGKAPVFCSINGESCLVKRGEWVKLKKKFLNVLQHAVVTEVEQDLSGEKTLRDVPRFNYQFRSLEEGHPVDTSIATRAGF